MSVLVLALLCGAVIGLALGALGGGGGVLAVPAQVYLLGVAPADAGTTSLIIVVVTSATALARHAGTGNIRWRTGALFAAAGAAPAIGASVLAHRLPQTVLTAAFAVLAAFAATAMLRGARTARRVPLAAASAERAAPRTNAEGAVPGSGRPGSTDTIARTAPRPAAGTSAAGATANDTGDEAVVRTPEGPAGKAGHPRTAAAGAGLGAVTGLLGVGGGFLAVPALVSVLRLPMRTAVATSLVVILVNAVASLTARVATGGASLDPAVLGPLVGAAVLGAWDGKRLGAKLSGTALRRAFAALLLAVAAFMLVDVFV
ncbi:TSUP family transporter [Streptomyces roseolilacinus]|uniref:TSUP family transporter n=1 Tax=Streptomyces roseolilacinus TaxID=66904 RepID=UPI0038188B02